MNKGLEDRRGYPLSSRPCRLQPLPLLRLQSPPALIDCTMELSSRLPSPTSLNAPAALRPGLCTALEPLDPMKRPLPQGRPIRDY